MDMLEILDQVREQLQHKGRLSYRLLQKQFGLDDDELDDLKYERVRSPEMTHLLVENGIIV